LALSRARAPQALQPLGAAAPRLAMSFAVESGDVTSARPLSRLATPARLDVWPVAAAYCALAAAAATRCARDARP
jgi:hypothetical protein